MRDTKSYTIFSGYDASSANFIAATTDIITSASHGLSNDDPIEFTTTDTLPAGLSIDTVYYVQQATTNTFKVSTTTGDSNIVDITDTGTGTHTWADSTLSHVVFGDGRHVSISLNASGTVAMTVKLLTSDQDTCPNFLQAVSATNMYDTTESIDLEDGTAGDGDSGLSGAALSAAASTRYTVNTDQSRWVALVVTAHTNGTLDALCRVVID